MTLGPEYLNTALPHPFTSNGVLNLVNQQQFIFFIAVRSDPCLPVETSVAWWSFSAMLQLRNPGDLASLTHSLNVGYTPHCRYGLFRLRSQCLNLHIHIQLGVYPTFKFQKRYRDEPMLNTHRQVR